MAYDRMELYNDVEAYRAFTLRTYIGDGGDLESVACDLSGAFLMQAVTLLRALYCNDMGKVEAYMVIMSRRIVRELPADAT